MAAGSEESVEIPSGDLRLEGRLSLPEDPAGAIVVCHPHPQYGGSMDVPVILTVTSRLRRAGYATLRFNFRGVGRSSGSYGDLEGEVEDAIAAAAFLRRASARDTLDIAGYSFGATVALRVATVDAAVRRVAVIAPPTRLYPIEFLRGAAAPILVLAGDRDTYTDAAEAERAFAAVGLAPRVVVLEGSDHFLFGFEDHIAGVIAAFLTGKEAS